MSSDTPTEQAEGDEFVQQVADPEEFNQQRRLRSIHDARDRARSIYEATQDPTIGESKQALAANYRAAVQNYIGELEGLLKKYDWESDGENTHEKNLWTGVKLGPIVVSPPQELAKLDDRNDVTVIDDSNLESRTHPIWGLRGYLNAAFPIQETFRVAVRERHQGQHTKAATVQVEMPVRVSYQAFRYTNDFLTRVGFDVEIETKQHRSVVTDELVEEVEEWRQQNLDK